MYGVLLRDRFVTLLSLRPLMQLEGVETLKYRCVCWPPFGNI